MTALLSYIPEDRACALTRGAALPSRTHGAVLFADISGFTPLTEALTQAHGPRAGIEALTEQINRVYAGLTTAVARWRGSVISFSGDAITCWFDDADGPAALRAAACALALQAAMAPLAAIALPGGRITSLALKVAVATGFARRFVVGDPAVQLLDVLAGSLLDRVAAGEHLARPGEILIDEISLSVLGAAVQISAQRGDPESGAWFSPLSALTVLPQASPWELAELPPATIRPWIARAVWERELAGLGAFITELRRVVTLFARFAGIDFDADDTAEARLDVLIRRAQAVIVDTGGTLLQLTVGDKGAYLYAAFGAPFAHEDDARRAARAALALHAIAVDLGLPPLQIGLSQGVVRTGAYGGPARRTYGALGDEVNVAARLMQAAPPGATLATARVRTLAGDTLSWEPLPALVLKGKAQPLAVYRLRSLRPDAPALQRDLLTAQPMVGRASELAQLETILDALAEARAGLTVVIEGEPGLGKSQLVAAVLGAARRRGVRALVGGGDGVEQVTPAFAWRAVFGQLLGLSVPAADPPAQQQYVRHQLRAAGENEDLAPLLNLVVPLGFVETAATAPLVGAARAEQTAELLLRLLRRAAAAEPLLIVLEDIQWLDPTSWELIHQLSAAQLVVLVLTTRPPELDVYEQYGPLLAAAETRWLSLHPLAADELVPLLCARLGSTQIAPEVAAFILERADGNPYFSMELAMVLRELGLVHVESGVCQFTPERQREAIVLPDTLQGLIGYRLDRLAPEEQLTVKVASVIGRVFAAQTLCAIHPHTPEPKELYEQLTAVEQLNLVVRDMLEPELRYAFRHIIAQEAIYSLLTTELQRSLHAAVARWLEEVYAADKGPYALLLAYHWQRADEPVRARGYLDMAGAQALHGGAYREARELLEQAALLEAKHAGPADPEGAALLRKVRRNRMLAEANYGLDGPTRALPYLRAALTLVGHSLPRSAIGLAAGSIVQLLRLVAHELRRAEAADRKPDKHLATELAMRKSPSGSPTISLASSRPRVRCSRRWRPLVESAARWSNRPMGTTGWEWWPFGRGATPRHWRSWSGPPSSWGSPTSCASRSR